MMLTALHYNIIMLHAPGIFLTTNIAHTVTVKVLFKKRKKFQAQIFCLAAGTVKTLLEVMTEVFIRAVMCCQISN